MASDGGIEPVLRGMLRAPAQEVDTLMSDGVRNFLFGTETSGLDLTSINIQRGRDHGLPDYNTARHAYGLKRVGSFAEICPGKPEVAQTLATLYASVDDIDLFVGGLAEDHAAGGSLGPLFSAIIVEQFTRLRDGDRFYYENHAKFPFPERIAELKKTTMCDIIARNSKDVECWPSRGGFHAFGWGQVPSTPWWATLLAGIFSFAAGIILSGRGSLTWSAQAGSAGAGASSGASAAGRKGAYLTRPGAETRSAEREWTGAAVATEEVLL